MAFPESLKLNVRQQAAFRCCRCQSIGIEIHHIIPQADNGPDTFENAAPLCPSCHDYFGANPVKRKEIKEMRNWWYRRVQNEKIADDKYNIEPSESKTDFSHITSLSALTAVNSSSLHRSPIKHDFLAQALINRIKIIYLLTKDYLSAPLDETIENFRRDEHPEQEIEVWERIINVVTSLERNHAWQKDKIKEGLKLALILSTSPEKSIDFATIDLLKPEIELVKSLWGHEPIVPITVRAN